MLELKNFHIDDEYAFYEGIYNHYYIYQKEGNYILLIQSLDQNGDIDEEQIPFTQLSMVIRIIEEKEIESCYVIKKQKKMNCLREI